MTIVPIDSTIRITNVSDGETVYQRCLLLKGTCGQREQDDSVVSITTMHPNGVEAFPEQFWPVAETNFKALLMLSPGLNVIEVKHTNNDGTEAKLNLSLTYIPLLQQPPLHLAILVAKDSPLVIDCPPGKGGGYSSAHSDLNAAIAKFRMTAYMWQAMTGENLRERGVGRRTFRLDEEWSTDTVSRDFLSAHYSDTLEVEGAVRSTAKVHIIRSSRTTKEIRDPESFKEIPKYFKDALKGTGGPFAPSVKPVVAGMILDTHWSPSTQTLSGFSFHGSHNNGENGINLGMYGSHLTYSWPRFIEEVTSCLTDIAHPGDKVNNDTSSCHTFWRACSLGQGRILQYVGTAFGLDMEMHHAGFQSNHWAKQFLPRMPNMFGTKELGDVVPEPIPQQHCFWSRVHALMLRSQPHFRLPHDPVPTKQDRSSRPIVKLIEEEGSAPALHLTSNVGIAEILCDGVSEGTFSLTEAPKEIIWTEEELGRRFDRCRPLDIIVFDLFGQAGGVSNVWALSRNPDFTRIPGTDIRVSKRSVCTEKVMAKPDPEKEKRIYWASLFSCRGWDGKKARVVSITTRVGGFFDGGWLTYSDGYKSHLGPMFYEGESEWEFGGNGEPFELPDGFRIGRVDVNRGQYDLSNPLKGVLIHFTDSDGEVSRNSLRTGDLNKEEGDKVEQLIVGPDEEVVGFYGCSEHCHFHGVMEFGILTVPRSVGLDGLPETAWELEELINTSTAYDEESSGDED